MRRKCTEAMFVLAAAMLVVGGCSGPVEDGAGDRRTSSAAIAEAAAGSIPPGMPSRLTVGLFEDTGGTWMRTSGVPWDVRYRYFTKGWVNNWGWGAYDGSWGLSYLRECDASGFIPAVQYYQMNGEPGGAEGQFLAKAQNATTMRGYFNDFKILMQRVRDFGKPVYILLEADGVAFLEQQSGNNPNAYAAVAATGMPELAGLPDTVAGWGLAFLQIRNAVGASNAILGMHVSAWASGKDIAYGSVSDPLGPEVDKVYGFLAPLGLASNQTGATYDVLVGDPLDRDSDYYRLVQNDPNRWWNASDSASINSRSFNRYAEWLRLWNQEAGKRWVLWQIPLGNSNHLNVCNNGGARQGYKDNRPEYFFGNGNTDHLGKFAQSGVIALLFGAGASCQSSYGNDIYTDGQSFMQSRVGAFYRGGGLPVGADGGTASDAGTPADAGTPPDAGTAPDGGTSADAGVPPGTPAFTSRATASPPSVPPGATTSIGVTVADTGSAVSDAIVDLEVYGPAGAKVAQQYYSGQSFAAGQTLTYSYDLTAPGASGTYTVKVGVFGPNWSPNYHWNDAAGTLAVASGDSAQYSFESGAQGFGTAGNVISGITRSTAHVFAGNASLAVNFAAGASGAQTVRVATPPTPAGATVTFHVWIPAGSALSSVQPYVLQGAAGGWRWSGSWRAATSLQAGAWNTITVAVPSNAATPLAELGVEFRTSSPWTGTCYVDSISW